MTAIGKRITMLALLGFLAIVQSGCSGIDGVELQGGVFEAMGIAGDLTKKKAEPKLAKRNGLVVPPDINALPAPGSGQSGTPAAQSWPQDPEQLKIAKADLEKRRAAKYCAEKDWWKMSNPQEFNRMTNNGALCQSALGKALSKGLRGN